MAHLIKNFLQKDLLKGVSEIVKYGRNHHNHMNINLYKNKKAFISTNYDCIFEYLFPLRSNCQASTDGFNGVGKAHEIREIECKKEGISIIRPHGTIIISRQGDGVKESRTYTKHSISKDNIEQFEKDINQEKIQPNIVFSTQNNKEVIISMDELLKLHNKLLKNKSISSLLFHGYSFVDDHILDSILQNPNIKQWTVCICENGYDSDLKSYHINIKRATERQQKIFLEKIIFVRVPDDLLFSPEIADDNKHSEKNFYSEELQSKYASWLNRLNNFDYDDFLFDDEDFSL